MERRDFRVEVIKTVIKQFVVEARTPEEAETIAEQWDKEGEGEVISDTIDASEAVPVEDGGDGDLQEVDLRDERESY